MYVVHYHLAKALTAEREAEARKQRLVAAHRKPKRRTWPVLWTRSRTQPSVGIPTVAAG